jgi:hypothetical protein
MSKRPWVIFGVIFLLLLIVAAKKEEVFIFGLFIAFIMAILRKIKRDTGSWFGASGPHLHQDDRPKTNIDGTPMMGSFDTNGNSYGVTSHHHGGHGEGH